MKLIFRIVSIKPYVGGYLHSVPESIPGPWIRADRKELIFGPHWNSFHEPELKMENNLDKHTDEFILYTYKKIG